MPGKYSYWGNIAVAVGTLSRGLRLTGAHLLRARRSKKKTDIRQADYFSGQQGITTIQFPHETLPVPDTGRYKLHNEIDDCIVCDKCAKICPVNCITIEPIRSAEEFGKTSDGTPKRIYAAVFDIDMGQCCFCGLCTTVCPTECLTMTPAYDFSVLDIRHHVFSFANMSEGEIVTKKAEWESYQQAKADAPAAPPPPPMKPGMNSGETPS
jgi:formate hydrogenlyase subunit 6/NADH:ubiquinone oxidoreductase subunit I